MQRDSSCKMLILCSICFRITKTINNLNSREGTNCGHCNSTSRDRQIVYQLHRNVIKRKFIRPFDEFKIIGVSDGYLVSKILTKIYRKNYTNYKYTEDPKLDIKKVPEELFGIADFLICSEVLEHVAPPVEEAFLGLFNLLKNKGKLIFSVPHTDNTHQHIEHFPETLIYNLEEEETSKKLIGVSTLGDEFVFENLVFHGGDGFTIEFRIFSENSVISNLEKVGFHNLLKVNNKRLIGAVWEPWSRVWVCQK